MTTQKIVFVSTKRLNSFMSQVAKYRAKIIAMKKKRNGFIIAFSV